MGNPKSPPNSGGVCDSNVIDKRAEHSLKAESPILITELGIVIDDNDLQWSKAESPILVTLLGIVTDDSA